MTIIQSNQPSDAIRQVFEQFSGALRLQAEHLEELHQSVNLLQDEQRRLEEVAARLFEPIEHSLAGGAGTRALAPSRMLACMRKLAAATYAGQVFELLAEETARMDVRTAVFDVRGRAAWGFAAAGFGPELSAEAVRTLVVSLNHNCPFRQAFEAACAIETNPAGLEQNPNVLTRLAPAADARIMLIPVKSAGCVAAVLYAETAGKRDPFLIDALQVLADFAGAQMDRLVVLNGAVEGVGTTPATENAAEASEKDAAVETGPVATQPSAVDEIPAEATSSKAVPVEPEMTLETVSTEQGAAASDAVVADTTVPVYEAARVAVPASETVPVDQEPAALGTVPMEPETAMPKEGSTSEVAAEPSQADEGSPALEQAASPSEEEEKIHRDARRFSKLLVSEIELYNKESVDEGRRSKDLYQRLKKDIDRSRETYEKRFAHTVANQFDYFHEELVRTLAENDPSLLGSGYPGPSV